MADPGPRGAGCAIVEKLNEQLEEGLPLILVQEAWSGVPCGGLTRFDERITRPWKRAGDEQLDTK